MDTNTYTGIRTDPRRLHPSPSVLKASARQRVCRQRQTAGSMETAMNVMWRRMPRREATFDKRQWLKKKKRKKCADVHTLDVPCSLSATWQAQVKAAVGRERHHVFVRMFQTDVGLLTHTRQCHTLLLFHSTAWPETNPSPV